MLALGRSSHWTIAVGCVTALAAFPAIAAAHHALPGPGPHLPPVQQNLELVGELEPTAAQGPMVDGQIADLAVFKNHAYLNSWDEPSCTKGGTYIVDIANPAIPKEIGFLEAADGYYHGEGAHVVSLDTPQFTGDLLAVNDEACSNPATRPPAVPATAGGFDLYDVTNPASPVLLVENAGDRSPDGSLVQDPAELANSYHSVFVWQDGPQAFLVGVDNTELADVDIYNITDPTDPELIADLDLVAEFPDIVGPSAHGNAIFHHDMVVKRIGAQMRMLVSYWDAGYVQLDVTNPANPTLITDTDFPAPRPADRVLAAGGQRARGRVLAQQRVLPRRRRGLRAVPADQQDHPGPVRRSRVPLRDLCGGADRSGDDDRRRHRVRRLGLHRHGRGTPRRGDDRGRRTRRLPGRIPGEGRRDRGCRL